MGKQSKDIDLVVDLPNGGIEIAEFLTKKDGSYTDGNPVTYPRYATAKFNLRNSEFSDIDLEAVMTRGEVYSSDSRKPDVEFTSLSKDAERRDLTINTLYYDISNKKIIDPTGHGIKDIKSKVLRTPLDPNTTFTDDPLRMMRLARFSCKYGWEIPSDMLKALHDNAQQLEKISKERVQDELNKIIMSDYPDKGIKLLVDTQLMKYIIPELYGIVGMTQNKYHEWDTFGHTLNVIKNSPKKLEVRMSALLHDIGKSKTKTDIDGKIQFLGHEEESGDMTVGILNRLKYPTTFVNHVKILVRQHMRTKSFGNDVKAKDSALRRLMHDMGENLEDLLDLIHADNTSHGSKGWQYNLDNQVEIIKDRLKKLGDFSKKTDIPLNGNQIMKWLDLKPGKDIGIILNKFTDIFLEDPDVINQMSDEEIKKLVIDIYKTIK